MNIIIIKLSALGDIIQSLPLVMAIREQRPNVIIDWVVERPYAELLLNHPALNQVFISPRYEIGLTKIKNILNFITQIRMSYYDIVFDLQGLIKSAIFNILIRSNFKIGFSIVKESISILVLNKRSFYFYNCKYHALDQYLNILISLGLKRPLWPNFGIKLSLIEMLKIKKELWKLGIKEKPLIIMHPMAKWQSKLWPNKYWIQLGKMLIRAGLDVVLTGSLVDRVLTSYIAEQVGGNIVNLAGETNLRELAALQSLAGAVVSTDTGAMHLAAAMKVPVVALFGPTSELYTGPYNNIYIILAHEICCRPCFRHKCYHSRCMEGIRPSQVLLAVKNIIIKSKKFNLRF